VAGLGALAAARRATVQVCDGAGTHRGQGLLLDLGSEGLVVLTCHHVIAPIAPDDLHVRVPDDRGHLADPVQAAYDVLHSRPEMDAVVLTIGVHQKQGEGTNPLLHALDPQTYDGALKVTGLTRLQPNTFRAELGPSTPLDLRAGSGSGRPDSPEHYLIPAAYQLVNATDSREGISGGVVLCEEGVLGLVHFARPEAADYAREGYVVPLTVWGEAWSFVDRLIRPLIDRRLRAAAKIKLARDLEIGLGSTRAISGATADVDIVIAGYRSRIYIERDEDRLARQALQRHDAVVLVGMALSGKTRLALELIRSNPDAVVVMPRTEPPSLFEASSLAGANAILFIDDLHWTVRERMQLLSWRERLAEATGNPCALICTSQDGDDWLGVQDRHAPLLDSLGRECLVFLSVGSEGGRSLSEEQGRILAEALALEVNDFQRRFDGTPGSLTLDLDEMRRRYEREARDKVGKSRLFDSVEQPSAAALPEFPKRELRTAAERVGDDLATSAAEAYVREYRPAAAHEVVLPSADRARQRSGRQALPIIDRETEQSALRGRLADGPFGAVVVNGLAGVGKSKLLDTVLDQMPDDPRVGPSALVVRRTVDAATRLDLKTFIDLLDDGTADPTSARGRASLARLEAVLNGIGDRQVILAVDAAENLLKPGTQKLADLDLDEALEFLTTQPDHRVSVVLAFRRPPTSPTGGAWPDVNGAIAVPQLKIAEFFGYLRSLDRTGALGLDDLDEAFRRKLHRHLLGNPRHAELVHALVTTVDRSIGLRDLADELFKCLPQEVSGRLTRLLAERLGPTRRRVLEALDAFATPVPGDAVISVLTAEHADSDVRQALAMLFADRVAYRNDDGEYFLPDPQAGIFLSRMDVQARSDLLTGAADELSALQAGTVTGVPDLRIWFAELNALLGAGRHQWAYSVIETIDHYLRKWNCSYLLDRQRISVRAKLDDDHLEMANENALAGIHVSRGEFQAASEAYQRALTKATALDDRASKLKIHLNQAVMYLEDNRTRQAQDLFELVLNDPGRVDDLSIRMGALEGLADCHRRDGRYDQAIRSAKLAQDLPQLTAFPDTRSAAEFSAMRRVVLSLKLSRWYAELGNLKTANDWMNAADATAAADEWLRPACLDGRADLLLAEGDIAAAIGMAREAVDRALATQDPITLLRARTTLCVAHLRTGQMVEARREIDRAARFRKPGHSLLVLALRALVTRHAGNSEAADGLFRRLENESRRRLDADDDDFAARDLLGLAICGRALDGRVGLGDAVACFRTARERTPPTPGLVERLRSLLEVLDSCGPEPGLLRPVIGALAGTGTGS